MDGHALTTRQAVEGILLLGRDLRKRKAESTSGWVIDTV